MSTCCLYVCVWKCLVYAQHLVQQQPIYSSNLMHIYDHLPHPKQLTQYYQFILQTYSYTTYTHAYEHWLMNSSMASNMQTDTRKKISAFMLYIQSLVPRLDVILKAETLNAHLLNRVSIEASSVFSGLPSPRLAELVLNEARWTQPLSHAASTWLRHSGPQEHLLLTYIYLKSVVLFMDFHSALGTQFL